MTRIVRFEQTETEFVFTCEMENQAKKLFKVDRESLSVSSAQLFEAMFSDLNRAPSFEFVEPEENLEKRAKLVYLTVKQIVEKAAEGIEQEWFEAVEEPDTTTESQ